VLQESSPTELTSALSFDLTFLPPTFPRPLSLGGLYHYRDLFPSRLQDFSTIWLMFCARLLPFDPVHEMPRGTRPGFWEFGTGRGRRPPFGDRGPKEISNRRGLFSGNSALTLLSARPPLCPFPVSGGDATLALLISRLLNPFHPSRWTNLCPTVACECEIGGSPISPTVTPFLPQSPIHTRLAKPLLHLSKWSSIQAQCPFGTSLRPQ
jgi:hypothetical protein